MFAKKLNTLKPVATITLDTRQPKKSGLFPVRLRIMYNRKYRHYPIGIDLSEIDFTLSQNLSALDKSQTPEKRRQIKEYKLLFDKVFVKATAMLNEIIDFSFEEFEQKMFGIRKSINCVFDVYEITIAKMRLENRVSTANNYMSSMRSLQLFKPHLTFKEVTPIFLNSFEKWFLAKGGSISTVGIYLRPLRAILNFAIEEKLMNQDDYPFSKRKYQIPACKNTKKALTAEEINSIYNYNALPNTWWQKAKDLWLFSFFANGLNMKDIAHLKKSNIEDEFIRVRRQKTIHSTRNSSKQISIFLSDDLKQIISRSQSSKSEYIFQLINDQQDAVAQHKAITQVIKMVNRYMGLIAKEIGIDKHITTYFARHSYATVLKRKGVSTEYISESLGHSNLKTTASYLDSFEDDRHKEIAELLSSFKRS
jgi:integrase/recombinase XerD